MSFAPKIFIAASLGVFLATSAFAAPRDFAENDKPVLIAENKTRAAGTKKVNQKGVREKFITREATVKGKDATKVDFDSVDIGGQRKTPMGTLINQNKADKNYDFVKIRLRWHPEMVQSASSLDSGAQ